MRRFGQWPKSGEKYTRRPGAYAILPINGGILATFQGGRHQEYQLPGGGIDFGESPIAALHREVLEETGWKIANPKVLFKFKRFTFMPEYEMWAEKICTLYVADPVYSVGPATEIDHQPVMLSYTTATRDLAVEGDRFAVSKFIAMG